MTTHKEPKPQSTQIIKYRFLKMAAGGGGASGGGGPRRPASSLMGQLVRQRQEQVESPVEDGNRPSGGVKP